ncbi:hypothetical protein [Maridesulfovibrio sp.]|uniref:hypothetical protein n=1 Tax=Maridesulfovibrio sp. TaxID=2795000 RepID=UPI002A18B860|nr:hypothetical protein [Maridesulfovibrio sp.]
MSNEEFEETIYGQVIPYTDEDDENYRYAIMVDNEEEYIVEPGTNSSQLEEYMDRWVRADVLITETDDGYFIKIRDIEPEESGWQYENEDRW